MSDAERTGLHIRERTTTRTARYVVLGAAPAQARRVWFVLHGYGMLAARFVRPFDGIIPARYLHRGPRGAVAILSGIAARRRRPPATRRGSVAYARIT
jgi:hypothetical protein